MIRNIVPLNTAPTAEIRRAGVDLNGLMSVLSKHLYSTPMVALRELVQNAHDSIIRRRLEQSGWQGPGRIEVLPDLKTKTLRIIDTGAGLTEHEIHAFLATVGAGYTGMLRKKDDETGLIGMFGLGFLSAFVLAKRVTVRSTSYQQPDVGFCYVSTNAEQYSVAPIAARAIGTEIILELHDNFTSLTSTSKLRDILERYCALLNAPIYIGGDSTAMNPEPPPWRRPSEVALSAIQQRRKNLEFAAHFEHDFEPICTLPITPDASSDAVGMLWIQDGGTYGTSDNRNLSVFLRGMLLDDDARDLLPPWAGFIGGVIESSRMTPTASREDLQRDAAYDHTQHALSEALITGLSRVAQQQPDAWKRVLLRHNEALLGASLCDERLFGLMDRSVRIPSSQGDLPTCDLCAQGAIHVILDRNGGFEEMLFRTLGVPVAYGNRYAVVPFLRRWCQAHGMRLVELGTEQGNRQLFKLAELPNDEYVLLQTLLADDEKLIVAHFSPAQLPLVVVPDREAELKQRLEEDAANKRMSTAALRLAQQFTAKIDATHLHRLYVNLDNPAIVALLQAHRDGNAQLDRAAGLLKTFKLIMSHQNQGHGSDRLSNALKNLSGAVQQLLK